MPTLCHRLSDVDEATSTATCSICGPSVTAVRRKTRQAPKGYHWLCESALRRYPSSWHGVSAEGRDALLAEQGGVCAICRTPDPGKGSWQLDHDHATKEIRGVLCPLCNRGLGQFKDDPLRLLAAVEYLNSPGNTATDHDGSTGRLSTVIQQPEREQSA